MTRLKDRNLIGGRRGRLRPLSITKACRLGSTKIDRPEKLSNSCPRTVPMKISACGIEQAFSWSMLELHIDRRREVAAILENVRLHGAYHRRSHPARGCSPDIRPAGGVHSGLRAGRLEKTPQKICGFTPLAKVLP